MFEYDQGKFRIQHYAGHTRLAWRDAGDFNWNNIPIDLTKDDLLSLRRVLQVHWRAVEDSDHIE